LKEDLVMQLRLVVGMAVGVTLAGAVTGVAVQEPAAPDPILVAPFENVGREARYHWLAEASAVLLTRHFDALGAAAIPRDDRKEAFEQLQLPSTASLTQATRIRVGELVGAVYLVAGSFTVADGRLSVRGHTIRLDSGLRTAEAVEEGELSDLLAVFERLARRLVPGGARSPAARLPDVGSLPAFESYIKGLVAESPSARERFLQAALAAAPGYDEARVALWQTYTEQGEHQRALAIVERVAPSSPLSRQARFLAGLSRIDLKDYTAAFDQLKLLLDEAPAAALHNNLGVIQIRRGATPQAGRPAYHLTKAVEAAPGDPDYHFNLGYAYWLERDPQAAIYWLKETVRRSPGDGEAHYILGAALQAAGATAEASRERELARHLSSTFAEWERRAAASGEPVPRGLERLRRDLEGPAGSLLDRVMAPVEQKDQRDLAAFHLDRARRLVEQARDVEALAELRRSLYISPYQAEAHLLAGRIHARAGRLAEAARDLRISLWCQETVAAHVALGYVLLEQKDLLGAQTEANLALVMDVGNAEARALLEKAGGKR
jgi:tetratricopeptide (TPR) repeat protein